MPPLSLRTALALAFAAVSVLMAVVLSWSLGQLATDAVRRDIGAALSELAEQMRSRLDLGLYERLRDVETLVALHQLRDPATQVGDNRLVLEKLRRSTGEIAWIGFARPDGKVVYSADSILEGADVSKRPWFIEGGKGSFVGDVHEAKLLAKILPPPASGEPLRFVDVAAPVFDLEGRFSGVLGVHLSWEWAREVEHTVFSLGRRAKGVETFVLNREGKVLLAPAGKEAAGLPGGLAQAASHGGLLLRWPDGRDYLTTVVPTRGYGDYAGLGWTVVVRQAAAEAYAPVYQLQATVLALGGGFAVLFALFGIWLAGQVAQPLAALASTADRLRSGEDLEVPIGGRLLETRRLASSLDHLLRALRGEQSKLAQLNASLEEQVLERTQLLDSANQHLFGALEERQRLVNKLEELASTDSLTGLYNRRAFHERAEIELRRVERQPGPLSALIFDIDHFKRVNDGYGHDIGDEAIRLLARTVSQQLRDVDILARFGGEEFVALLPNTTLDAALEIAERLRIDVAAISIPCPAGPIAITASFGAAEWEPGIGIDTLIARADQALYGAKHTGRNRVEAWRG
ncbi:sensor domain-containing diguanylate cyclase [Chitinimonas koreensis]|uniref:sensor domain-containing diguanylate cyclase n=1 Tax=Chitinimonas koreensis TaxID=356302 RepID=UPI00040E927C|nr:sensor domain-containing diguanylate cyclase [Chitinimonas koreensis]QNM97773.1 diguanylate cyclase [Chitinimonas koreensis]